MDEIIRSCYENSLKILTANKVKLIELAQALIARETLDFDELEAIFRGETLPPKPLVMELPKTQPESTVQPKPDGILKPQPAAPR